MKSSEKFNYFNDLDRANLEYIEQKYQEFINNSQGLDPQWHQFFKATELTASTELNGAIEGAIQGVTEEKGPIKRTIKEVTKERGETKDIEDTGEIFSHSEHMVFKLIEHYRDYGHLKANLDPLGIQKAETEGFELRHFNLKESDLKNVCSVGQMINCQGDRLEDIINYLDEIYCGTLAIHVAGCELEVRLWFHLEMETQSPDFHLSPEDKISIFHSLVRTESLEQFIHTRYMATKRFSVEGGDALLPMLEHSVVVGTQLGIKEVVLGMAHRGRVNVLANFMDKGLDMIFADFDGTVIDNTDYDGDVKYHMGYSADKKTAHGECHISLAFNPSHLECVTPVVCGMVRAKQRRHQDTKTRSQVIPILIHGDAAFIGQGVVSETFQLSQLEGYKVGGSIHIIINNQVGFTTNPNDARSTRYSSDVAKSINAPVILVNGDDVEACVRAMDIAIRFRQEFKQDIVIDMICYRRFGHNEGDEPNFTQPQMYAKIKKQPTLMTIYGDDLACQSLIKADEVDKLYQEQINKLQKMLDETRAHPPELKPLAFNRLWSGLRRSRPEDFENMVDTKYSKDKLLKVSQALTVEPESFHLNSKVKRLIGNRKKMIEEGAVDWGLGELLTYASLCDEGIPVRVSGQDCKRGTFSHRHAVYFDQKTGTEYCPLKMINPQGGEFSIYNSSLSEMAVLGFEYGNSTADPTFLAIWEAQFGDFVNGAQIIIDQFISSGEQKWTRHNGLTLLLPHGYEGQGPEHSSARLERFLQLCGQENMQVCNLTTPANFFHGLRRQIVRDIRKPLIIMSPKSLLRHPKVMSPLRDLYDGHFKEVIEDTQAQTSDVEFVLLCSGKIYYEIEAAREAHLGDFAKKAIVRVEQMYPFPRVQLAPSLSGYPNLKRVCWVQEEPRNMGAYECIIPRLRELMDDLGLKKVDIGYVGRTERASPATGSPKAHRREQESIIEACIKFPGRVV